MLTLKEAQMAVLLGVSDRRVRQYVDEGLAVRVAPGEYDASATVQNMLAAAANKGKNTEAAIDKEREEARLKKEQADHWEQRNAALRKELLPVDEVVRVWSEQISSIRGGLLAVVPRVSQRLSLSPEDAQEIDIEIRDAMTKLADGVEIYNGDIDPDAGSVDEGDGDSSPASENQSV